MKERYRYVILILNERNTNMNDEIVIYTSNDGSVKVDVRLEEGNVWLTQEQICILYGKSKSTISEHIRNIFKEEELQPEGG